MGGSIDTYALKLNTWHLESLHAALGAEEAAWDVDEAAAELPQLSDSDDESGDGYYFITSRPAPGGDIYQASRVGDVERVECVCKGTQSLEVLPLNREAIFARPSLTR